MGYLISLAGVIYAFYLMRKIKARQIDGPFTTSEKIQIIVTLLLSTLPSWAIYYFGWKNTLPQKAGRVNKYLLWIIGALVTTAIIGIVIAFVIVGLKKS